MLIPTLLLAATVSLSPEIPLGTPSMQAAGAIQSLGSVASNGRDFVAVWEDQRTVPLGPIGMWAGRIDGTGTPLEPTGHPLNTTSGLLTWDGTEYLLISQSIAQPLDENGRVAGDPIPMHLTVAPTEVASNGSTILSVGPLGFNLNGLDGRLIADQGFPPIVRSVTTPAVLTNSSLAGSDDYAFVITLQQCGSVPCDQPVELVVVSGATGAVRYLPLNDIGNGAYGAGATATPDGTILVSWVEQNGAAIGAKYEIVDPNGHTVVPPALINSAAFLYAQQPVVGWDGHEFLVLIAWTPPSGQNPTLHGYRISTDGTLLDTSEGFVLTSTYWQHARIAHSANAVLVAWDDFNGVDVDVVGRGASSFDTIERADTNVLAMSAQTELLPRVAEGGAFAIWNEPALGGELHEQPIGGREDIVTNSVLSSAVARGKSSYLVVWTAVDPKAYGGLVYARRLGLDGIFIDPNPILIGHITLYDVFNMPPPAAASDGTNFFVVWTGDYDIQGVRISEANGTLVDAAPFAVSSIGPHSGTPIAPRVVWDGTQYVVGWIDSMFLNTLISPVPPIPDFIRMTRVTSGGTVLDAKTIAVWNLGDATSLGLAANANGVTAVWSGYPDTTHNQICLWAAQLAHDGTVVTPAREMFCNAVIDSVDVAWSGTEFVTVWHDATAADIKAQRFGATLLPLDTEPFEVSPSGARAIQPSIASSPVGTTIAYVRVANEPQFASVPRVFVRTLAKIGGATWPRAARH